MKQNRWKILISLLLAIGFLSLPFIPDEAGENAPVFGEYSVSPLEFSDGFGVNAECAFLCDGTGNTVLLSQNADKRHGMASTTKIMTAVLALELLETDREVVVTKDMVGVEGSSIYLSEGESLTVMQLLYGLMLESGNDAAVALAIAGAGSVARFVYLMNAKAALLGLQDTHFENPHGLTAEGHYTTARELGLLTCYALENPVFRKIVSTYRFDIPYKGKENGRVLVNHNPLLKRYGGMIGVKTGWTTADGKCFVTAAEKDGLTLVAVTLGDSNISATHRALLDHGFANFAVVTPSVDSSPVLPLVGGTKEFVSLALGRLPCFCLPKGESVTARLEAPGFLYAGIKKGETAGRVVFLWNGKEIGETAVFVTEDTEVKKSSFLKRIFEKHG